MCVSVCLGSQNIPAAVLINTQLSDLDFPTGGKKKGRETALSLSLSGILFLQPVINTFRPSCGSEITHFSSDFGPCLSCIWRQVSVDIFNNVHICIYINISLT